MSAVAQPAQLVQIQNGIVELRELYRPLDEKRKALLQSFIRKVLPSVLTPGAVIGDCQIENSWIGQQSGSETLFARMKKNNEIYTGKIAVPYSDVITYGNEGLFGGFRVSDTWEVVTSNNMLLARFRFIRGGAELEFAAFFDAEKYRVPNSKKSNSILSCGVNKS